MEWEGQRESENVEDRRGETGGGMFGSSYGSGIPGGPMVFHGGLGTIAVILLVSIIFGVNPLQLLQQVPQGNPGGQSGRRRFSWRQSAGRRSRRRSSESRARTAGQIRQSGVGQH